MSKQPQVTLSRKERYTTIQLTKLLSTQDFTQISKSREKWTDDLFPPEDSSIFSGKTDFSNFKSPEIPKFLKVSNINLFNNRKPVKINSFLKLTYRTKAKNIFGNGYLKFIELGN
jgi:hypothetical protein